MIGSWVVRWRVNSTALTKYHLIESEITDRKVTRCGRQMGHIVGTELAWAGAPSPVLRCKVCDR